MVMTGITTDNSVIARSGEHMTEHRETSKLHRRVTDVTRARAISAGPPGPATAGFYSEMIRSYLALYPGFISQILTHAATYVETQRGLIQDHARDDARAPLHVSSLDTIRECEK